ncbi:WecB/TagA/CpsF family glycosyltransferase [Pseudarthrobacter sp. J1763]|uniref:WecB/TagA/CpsF family glycosyltransferase n=1 Tax=Pseudarthrobacter sp. J1763 TaxID=3420445 RepID=UPI003D282934
MSALARERVPFLGVTVTPLRVEQLIPVIGDFLNDGQVHTIAGHNLHSVTLCHSDEAFFDFYQNSDVVLMDGAPVVYLWGSRNEHQGRRVEYRLGSTDWIPELFRLPQIQRVLVVGSTPEANLLGVARLQEILPDATVQGLHGSDWDQGLERQFLNLAHDFKPQLVLLGLGMPLQEHVLLRNKEALPPATYCTVGGAIDQLGGVQRLAPRWLGRMGFEWAWRLMLHPSRVASRVFVEPWILGCILARKKIQRFRKQRALKKSRS